MRSREEIEKGFADERHIWGAAVDDNHAEHGILLEVLLDIRELLGRIPQTRSKRVTTCFGPGQI